MDLGLLPIAGHWLLPLPVCRYINRYIRLAIMTDVSRRSAIVAAPLVAFAFVDYAAPFCLTLLCLMVG